MNAHKYIAVVAALLITFAGVAGIANYSNAAAVANARGAGAEVSAIQTLPAIHVSPTPEQLRELRSE